MIGIRRIPAGSRSTTSSVSDSAYPLVVQKSIVGPEAVSVLQVALCTARVTPG